MKKSASFEWTFSQQEIEKILWEHLSKKLMKEDKDFKDCKFIQPDFTYNFSENRPTIDAVVILGDLKLRKP